MLKCRWYVLHAYSGYEKKVADSILDQANKLGISEHIEEISVPTQNIVEVKRQHHELFQTASIETAVDLSRMEEVFIIISGPYPKGSPLFTEK